MDDGCVDPVVTVVVVDTPTEAPPLVGARSDRSDWPEPEEPGVGLVAGWPPAGAEVEVGSWPAPGMLPSRLMAPDPATPGLAGVDVGAWPAAGVLLAWASPLLPGLAGGPDGSDVAVVVDVVGAEPGYSG